jgi:hypothetical protein
VEGGAAAYALPADAHLISHLIYIDTVYVYVNWRIIKNSGGCEQQCLVPQAKLPCRKSQQIFSYYHSLHAYKPSRFEQKKYQATIENINHE